MKMVCCLMAGFMAFLLPVAWAVIIALAFVADGRSYTLLITIALAALSMAGFVVYALWFVDDNAMSFDSRQ